MPERTDPSAPPRAARRVLVALVVLCGLTVGCASQSGRHGGAARGPASTTTAATSTVGDACVGIPSTAEIESVSTMDDLGAPTSVDGTCTLTSASDPTGVVQFSHEEGTVGIAVRRRSSYEPVPELHGAIAGNREVAVVSRGDVFAVQVVSPADHDATTATARCVRLLKAWGKA